MPEFSIQAPLRLFAPAKVNLGLEILGRRDDGFHEVLTLMETISLFDVIDIHPAASKSITSPAGIPDDDDLTARALDLLEQASGRRLCLRVTVEKSIPVSAGLGGGSSDAGTLIGAIGQLLGIPLDEQHDVASKIGSDVPFFLTCGLALASGTGTDTTLVPDSVRRWYVIAVPDLEIQGKTGTLYRSLQSNDFSDGSKTSQLAHELSQGLAIDRSLVTNTFQRPLMTYPAFRETIEALERAGSQVVVPSGAGPSVFSVFATFGEAVQFAGRLNLPDGLFATIASSIVSDPNQSRIDYLLSKS